MSGSVISEKKESKEEKASDVDLSVMSLIPLIKKAIDELEIKEGDRAVTIVGREMARESKSIGGSLLLDFYSALQLLIATKKLVHFSPKATQAAFDFIKATPEGESFQARVQDIQIIALTCAYASGMNHYLQEFNDGEDVRYDEHLELDNTFIKNLNYLVSSDTHPYVTGVQRGVARWKERRLHENFENLAILIDFDSLTKGIDFIFNCIQAAVPEVTAQQLQDHFKQIVDILQSEPIKAGLECPRLIVLMNMCEVLKNHSMSSAEVSYYLEAIARIDMTDPGIDVSLTGGWVSGLRKPLEELFDDISDKDDPQDKACMVKTALELEKGEFKEEKEKVLFIREAAFFAATMNYPYTFRFCLAQQRKNGSFILYSDILMGPYRHKTNSERSNPIIMNFLMAALKSGSLIIAKHILLTSQGYGLDSQESKLISGGVQYYGNTALYYACRYGHYAFAEKLIQLGARSFGHDQHQFYYPAMLLKNNHGSESLRKIFRFFSQESHSFERHTPISEKDSRDILDVFCKEYQLLTLTDLRKQKEVQKEAKKIMGSFQVFGIALGMPVIHLPRHPRPCHMREKGSYKMLSKVGRPSPPSKAMEEREIADQGLLRMLPLFIKRERSRVKICLERPLSSIAFDGGEGRGEEAVGLRKELGAII
jgi:hypothetical protein